MKEIAPNIFVVVMPIETHSFEKANLGNALFYKDGLNNICKHKSVSLLGMEILGTASEKEITFDCEPYVKNIKWTNNGEFYETEEPSEKLNEDWYKNESFLSLLKSKGVELKPNEKLLVLKKH